MYLFETMRLENGKILRQNYHFQRMQHASLQLNIPFSPTRWLSCIDDLTFMYPSGLYRTKVILDESGQMDYECHTLPHTKEMTARLIRMNEDIPDWHRLYKTSNREYLHHSKESDLILLYDKANKILEFDIGNMVLQFGDAYYTPSFNHDFLSGCMRQFLLDRGLIQTKYITVEELKHVLAKGGQLWMINSLREWVPVILIK
ncbi:aminotransferase class IV [Staphylococcus felis]|uniref:aminotransferase class IV n=1 Tax=Staphylococcus felis TaxID=46127 RepID=UPI000E21E4ED|nr:aminotransferase class IV [Staphylococcus felis]REI06425.1 aminodeoxychorismate lyase [Staphylococcus felis]